MKISPHLVFNGSCREAFEFYSRILGGTISTMLAYGDTPMAEQTPVELRHRILHATLVLDGGVELTGVDIHPPDFRPPQGFFVTLTIAHKNQAERCFAALAEGGAIQLAYAPTFWSSGFGIVVDRFGIPWEINTATE